MSPVLLTLSSILYVLTSFVNVLYSASLAKEREELALVKEGVDHVWSVYVKSYKKEGRFGLEEKRKARELVISYVKQNESKFCICFKNSKKRLISLINDIVASRKAKGKQNKYINMHEL